MERDPGEEGEAAEEAPCTFCQQSVTRVYREGPSTPAPSPPWGGQAIS
jgi:hypothetical protein